MFDGGRAGGGAARPERPPHAALAPGLRSSRRPTWAAAGSGRWSGSRRCSAVAAERGLRTHLDGARLLNATAASGEAPPTYARRLRHRLDRLQQGARGAGRRLPGRLGGADRGSLALQADVRRRDAPGGDRRRRAPSARSTTTSSGSPRTTRTPAPWPRRWPGSTGSRSSRRRSRRTSSSSRSPTATRWSRRSPRRGVEMSNDGRPDPRRHPPRRRPRRSRTRRRSESASTLAPSLPPRWEANAGARGGIPACSNSGG